MIKLHAPYDDRLEVKQLGARWNSKEKYWYIPKGVDFHSFKKWIPPEEYDTLEQSLTPIALQDLFNKLTKDIILPSHQYTIEGDVMDLYDLPQHKFCIFQLIDQHEFHYPLQVSINYQDELNTDDFIDKRIRITGTLHFYQKSGVIQLKTAKLPIVLGPCSRIAERNALALQFKFLLTSEKHESVFRKRMMDDYFNTIGIIAPPKSLGYNDFCNHLNAVTCKRFDFFNIHDEPEFSGSMNADFIVKSIQHFNMHPLSCRIACICIVRGGGNKEEFCMYNSPELLTTIFRSKIPIITGIGHDDDTLLCDELVDCNAGTPTGAAEKLNEFASSKLKKERYAERKKMEHDKSATIDWKQLYAELEADNITLRLENQSLREQLEKSHKKGFFSRLFG